MSLRIAFDLDGVLADIKTAYNGIVERLFVPRTTDSVTGTAESDEKEEDSSETAAADVARDEEGARRDEVALKGLTRRQQNVIWRALRSTPDFWATLSPLEPGLVFRISEVAARYRWDLFLWTQRPATAGETVQ